MIGNALATVALHDGPDPAGFFAQALVESVPQWAYQTAAGGQVFARLGMRQQAFDQLPQLRLFRAGLLDQSRAFGRWAVILRPLPDGTGRPPAINLET